MSILLVPAGSQHGTTGLASPVGYTGSSISCKGHPSAAFRFQSLSSDSDRSPCLAYVLVRN